MYLFGLRLGAVATSSVALLPFLSEVKRDNLEDGCDGGIIDACENETFAEGSLMGFVDVELKEQAVSEVCEVLYGRVDAFEAEDWCQFAFLVFRQGAHLPLACPLRLIP